MIEQRDPIEYLLDAMENAAQSGNPFAAGYGGKRQAVLSAIAELRAQVAARDRRLLHIATSNADDWRWYQNQARQACRALGIARPELNWGEPPARQQEKGDE